MTVSYIDLLQWGGTVGILVGLFLMERKSVWAPVLLGVGAILMALFGLTIKAYGVVVTNLGATILSTRAFLTWRKATHKDEQHVKDRH